MGCGFLTFVKIYDSIQPMSHGLKDAKGAGHDDSFVAFMKGFNTLLKGLSTIFAVLGFALTVGYFSIQISKITPPTIARISRSAANVTESFIHASTLTFSASKLRVASNEPFTLSWHRSGTASNAPEGSYSLYYPCTKTAYLEVERLGDRTLVLCNTIFTMPGQSNGATARIFANPRETTDVPIVVMFTPNGASKANLQEQVTMSITGGSIPATLTASIEQARKLDPIGASIGKPIYIPGKGQDLALTILDVGYIDQKTGAYIASKNVHYKQRAAVRFEVKNVGTATSDTWTFSSNLPTSPAYNFTSYTQNALKPGAAIQLTLEFNSIDRDEKVPVSITVGSSAQSAFDSKGYLRAEYTTGDANPLSNTDTATFIIDRY